MSAFDNRQFLADLAMAQPAMIPQAPRLELPKTIFISFMGLDRTGEIGINDFDTTLKDAAKTFFEEQAQGRPCRVLQIDFDVETNAPETIRDVTADCVDLIAAGDA